jgi:hypothetical protein
VSALLVLDSEGGRVAVKYFDSSILGSATIAANAAAAVPGANTNVATKAQEVQLKAELSFEKKVFAKTARNQQRQDGYDTIRQ